MALRTRLSTRARADARAQSLSRLVLAVIETHPIQYHAPVYRALQGDFGVPVTAIYGSDFSIAGYHDVEFKSSFRWDADLLSGYASEFLSRADKGLAKKSAAGLSHRFPRAPTALQPVATPAYRRRRSGRS